MEYARAFTSSITIASPKPERERVRSRRAAHCAPGRDQETKRRVVDHVFGELTAFLQKMYDTRPLAISLELQELDADLRRNKNNLKVGVAAAR